MNRRLLALILCVSATAVSAVSLGSRRQESKAQDQTIRNEPAAQAPEPPPDHIAYMFLFGQHVYFKQQADKLERQSNVQAKQVAALRSIIKREARLNDYQAAVFDQIASDCAERVAIQDKRAKDIVDALAARYPDGKLPKGVELPPPPPELETLQQERDAIIIDARNRLHASLGDEDFARFDRFVKNKTKSNIKPTDADDLQRKDAPQ